MIKLWRRWRQAYLGLLWDFDGWVTRLWFRRRVRLSGRCEACGECCRRLVLWRRGHAVRSEQEFEELVRADPFTYSRFVPAGQDAEGDWLFGCTKLGEDNQCTVHAERPVICRRYPEPRMFLHGARLPEGCSYEVLVHIRELA
jgi:uncharacterized protein